MKLKVAVAIAILSYAHHSGFGQSQREEQVSTSFFSMQSSPIKVEVKRSTDKIEFICSNKSYLTYEVGLEFSEISNLRPVVRTVNKRVPTGVTKLIEFLIIDSNIQHSYLYSVRYSIAPSNTEINEDFPYLIPFKAGTKVQVSSRGDFQASKSDTIFAARKGIITALPNGKEAMDRISDNSLEILHDDGSIAVYKSLDPEIVLVKPGARIVPGQPIGILSLEYLRLRVYRLGRSNNITSVPIKYQSQDSKLKSLHELEGEQVVHDPNVITRELSQRERNKYIKKNKPIKSTQVVNENP